MASSPETAPSKKNSNNSTTSPPSYSSKSDSSPPSPTPSSLSPSHSPLGKSRPPSPSPSSPPDSKSPPSPPPSSQKSPPPSSPPPSSPPPSSPPPSSPPPPRSSPPPPPSPSPPPPGKDKDNPPSPPPDSGSDSLPPPPPSEATSETPSSSLSSPSPSPSTPSSPPSTGTSAPTASAAFSPPPSINALSPPGVPKLVLTPPRLSPTSSNSLSRSSGSSSNHVGIIAGGAVGGALVLAVMVVVLLCILRKKRKPAYYIETTTMPSAGGRPGGHGEYYPGDQRWNGPSEHIIKVPPPSRVMVPPPTGWGPTPSGSNHPSPAFSDPRQQQLTPISPNMNLGRSQFSYDELATATGGFSQSKLLGQGGFGYVHKGVLPNGQVIAVKSLKSGSGQGEREFQAEVEIISRVHHRHLVSLVGYCMANEQRMLVYEFVPNSTLEFHLHGKGRPVMDWATRLRIAVGSAKGLAYLHEDCHPKIIHRDIKAANILLDNNFEAMVADFGLAKLSSDNITHVSTRVMGTFGYLAPEYASSGKLTEKSDVFSFGVMLLELITGRRPLDPTSKFMEDSLVDWTRPLMTKAIESGNYDELVDPRLEGNYVPQEMARMVSVAASSIRHSAKSRPRMSQIVRTLEGEQLSLDDQKSKPGQSGAFGVTQAYDTTAYNADMLKFKKMVMSSQEFPSSGFGDSTSEYGTQLSTSSDSDANYHSDNAQKV